MQLGQDITKFELPANFLTPFSATQATEDVLTVISGTERGLEDWKSLSDVQNLDAMERFLAVLKVYLDMEALRAEEGTGGGTKTAFILPPMKKPINSVLGETHRVPGRKHRVGGGAGEPPPSHHVLGAGARGGWAEDHGEPFPQAHLPRHLRAGGAARHDIVRVSRHRRDVHGVRARPVHQVLRLGRVVQRRCRSRSVRAGERREHGR